MKVSTDVSNHVEKNSKIWVNSLFLNGGEYENRTRVHGFAIRCVPFVFNELLVEADRTNPKQTENE